MEFNIKLNWSLPATRGKDLPLATFIRDCFAISRVHLEKLLINSEEKVAKPLLIFCRPFCYNFFFFGHGSFTRKKTQTAVTNIRNIRTYNLLTYLLDVPHVST